LYRVGPNCETWPNTLAENFMAIYCHSVWLSVVQSVSGRCHTNFGTFRMFQDGRASVSGQTFSRLGRFRIDFQSFQSNFTPELPLNSFNHFIRVTFQSLSGFSRSGQNLQSFMIKCQPLVINFQPFRMTPYNFQDVSVWSILSG
jgi:hypothetical protein